MGTLVVQAHPLEDSYNAALLRAVAAMTPDARIVRLGQGDEWTHGMALGATSLVVVYPTWWGSVPAVLLDALNQLLGEWVDGVEPRSTSPLRTVESLTVITTHGSPKRVNMLQGEPGRQLWKRTVLPLCARRATFSWQALYGLDTATPADRAAFLGTLSIA